MKKFFTLCAVAVMATASAWADGFTISDLGNQKQVRFRSYWVATNYLGVSGNNLVATTSATTEFILVETETAGNYYLYDAVSEKFVGKTPSAESAVVPCTSNLADAGVYTFATNSVTDGSHDNSIDRIRINCVNPLESADPTLHYTGNGDNVICYRNQEWGGNAWQIMNVTTPSDADWQEAYEKVHPTPVGPTAEEISELQEKISNVYAACTAPGVNRVGYPNATNNSATISVLYPYTNNFDNSITAANYNDALAALNAVYALTDVNLPEYGKAYKLAFRLIDGSKKYIAASNIGSTVTDNIDEAAVYVAGNNTSVASGYPYVFVDQNARVLRWENVTSGDLTAKGHDIQIGKTVTYAQDNSFTNVTATVEQSFGTLVLIASYWANGGGRWQAITLDTTTGELSDQDWNTAKANFKEGLTAAIEFEEVENPNKLKLSNPNPEGTSGLDNKSVGTFSAPFAVQLPTGVEAYKASVDGSTVSFESIGSIVPANTGVLVYASDGTTYDNVNAIPAASTVDVDGNVFEPVVKGTVAIGDYVLGKGSNGVGFYARVTPVTVANKAYIPASVTPSNLNAFRFDFEEGATSIKAVESAGAATVFDLQGRRVQNAKSGLYIVNGKKVIR